MSYLIKVSSSPTYWSGNEEAVWTGNPSEGKEYSTKKTAEADSKEISEIWGYTLEAIKSDDAPEYTAPTVETEEVVAE